MKPTLDPNAVLRLDRAVQLVSLPNDRILARHEAGVALLGGVTLDDLHRLLGLIDGRRTVASICREMADVYEADDVPTLLGHLVGDILHLHPDQTNQDTLPDTGASIEPQASTLPLTVVGDGSAAAALFSQLIDSRTGTPSLLRIASFTSCLSADFRERERRTLLHFTPGTDPYDAEARTAATLADLETQFKGMALVVCLLEGVPYQALFDVQEACLRANVPGLFVTADPDGLRIGPTVIPGPSPCLACAQIANVRFLNEEQANLLPTLAHFRTQPIHDALREGVVRAVIAEIQAILTPSETPALLGQVMHIPKQGAPRRYAFTQAPGCPLCTSAAARRTPPSGRLADLATEAALTQLNVLDQYPRLAVPDRDQALCRSVCILGGGTAGYLTALALRHTHPYLDVTLIESSQVPIIGVGEATTPLMPQFLHVDLGLDIHEFFQAVQPTFKLGIRFDWGQADRGSFNYPFGPIHVLDALLHGGDVRSCSLQSLMMKADVLPVWDAPSGFRSRLGTEIAYHLENRRFVRYLQQKAITLGVEHIEATIVEVETAADGETVERLVAEDRRRFAFDLYIDCSGFRSMLLEKALGSQFVSYERSLFADGAVIAAVPRTGRIQPYTTATAMDAGWCWNTPQVDIDHRGYVFASAFRSPEDAVAEMQRTHPGLGEPRVLRFRPGRHEHFWKGNVVAMGNAYGFVEPLESTALHMLIRQIGLLVRAFPLRLEARSLATLLNRKVNAYWDYLGWFLALHYKFNPHWSTPFWQACRADVEVSRHYELIEAFHEHGPLSYDRSLASAFDYPDPLWGAEGIDLILTGQHVPFRRPHPLRTPAAWHRWRSLCETVAGQALPQRPVLALANKNPALLDHVADAFRTVGPAFGRPPSAS